jgi:hypothetical protein
MNSFLLLNTIRIGEKASIRTNSITYIILYIKYN